MIVFAFFPIPSVHIIYCTLTYITHLPGNLRQNYILIWTIYYDDFIRSDRINSAVYIFFRNIVTRRFFFFFFFLIWYSVFLRTVISFKVKENNLIWFIWATAQISNCIFRNPWIYSKRYNIIGIYILCIERYR